MSSDASSNSSTLSPQKDEQLWFDDGNVVIVARNAVAFRVYKFLLARASPIFQDLFAIGNADTTGTEMMDGCPVVHVADTPQDMGAFSKLIFEMTPQRVLKRTHVHTCPCCNARWLMRRFLSLNRALVDRVPVSYRTLAGITRCAHKYQADTTLEHARTRLLQIFRSEPFCTSRLESAHYIIEQQPWRAFTDNRVVSDMKLTDAFETLSLLRLMDPDTKDTRTLSLALYMCMLCDPCVLRNGISHPGTEEVFRLSDHDYTLCITAMQKLSQDIRRVYQLACDALLQDLKRGRTLVARGGGWAQPSPYLGSTSRCTVAGNGCYDFIAQIAAEHALESTSYPLSTLLDHVDLNSSLSAAISRTSGLCSSCSSFLRRSVAQESSKILSDLPRYFSLPYHGDRDAAENEAGEVAPTLHEP